MNEAPLALSSTTNAKRTVFEGAGLDGVGRRRPDEGLGNGAGFAAAVRVLGAHSEQVRAIGRQVVNHVRRRVASVSKVIFLLKHPRIEWTPHFQQSGCFCAIRDCNSLARSFPYREIVSRGLVFFYDSCIVSISLDGL